MLLTRKYEGQSTCRERVDTQRLCLQRAYFAPFRVLSTTKTSDLHLRVTNTTVDLSYYSTQSNNENLGF